MTILLIVYILSGQFTLGVIPFNSFTACEAAQSLIVQEPTVLTTACFTEV